MAETILRLEGIRKELELSRDVRQTILPNLSLEIFEGEFVAITGPSGSGKSTLLYIMGGLDKPTFGKVWLDGQEITGLDEAEMTVIRNRKIGFIYQFHFLLPEFSAVDNVMMPMLIRRKYGKKEIRERAMKLLDMVGLEDKYTNKPNQLSGGQQQRVAIARALSNDPLVILADEATGNLDSKSGQEILAMFDDLHAQGRTLVFVTHDERMVERCTRILRLKDGYLDRDEPGARAKQLAA